MGGDGDQEEGTGDTHELEDVVSPKSDAELIAYAVAAGSVVPLELREEMDALPDTLPDDEVGRPIVALGQHSLRAAPSALQRAALTEPETGPEARPILWGDKLNGAIQPHASNVLEPFAFSDEQHETRSHVFTHGTSRARLAAMGPEPHRIDGSLTFVEAVGCCRLLPPVQFPDRAMPVGWGIFVPQGVPVHVRLRGKATDSDGNPVIYGSRGLVACMWLRSAPKGRERVVLRLWFYGEPKAYGPVDIYEDQIGGVPTLQGIPLATNGWELRRLDGPGPTDTAK